MQFLLIALKILQSDCNRDLKGGWQLLLWAHKISWSFSGIIWPELWALNFVGRPVSCLLLHIHRSAPEKVCFEDKELFIWKYMDKAAFKIAQGKQNFVRPMVWVGRDLQEHLIPPPAKAGTPSISTNYSRLALGTPGMRQPQLLCPAHWEWASWLSSSKNSRVSARRQIAGLELRTEDFLPFLEMPKHPRNT